MAFALTGFTDERSHAGSRSNWLAADHHEQPWSWWPTWRWCGNMRFRSRNCPCCAFAYSKARQRTQTVRQCSRKSR